jgi:hypothetical protein
MKQWFKVLLITVASLFALVGLAFFALLIFVFSGGLCGGTVYKAGHYQDIHYVIDEYDCGSTTPFNTRVTLKRQLPPLLQWVPWLAHEQTVWAFEEQASAKTIQLQWVSPKTLVIHTLPKRRVWQQQPQWEDVTITVKHDLPPLVDKDDPFQN